MKECMTYLDNSDCHRIGKGSTNEVGFRSWSLVIALFEWKTRLHMYCGLEPGGKHSNIRDGGSINEIHRSIKDRIKESQRFLVLKILTFSDSSSLVSQKVKNRQTFSKAFSRLKPSFSLLTFDWTFPSKTALSPSSLLYSRDHRLKLSKPCGIFWCKMKCWLLGPAFAFVIVQKSVVLQKIRPWNNRNCRKSGFECSNND